MIYPAPTTAIDPALARGTLEDIVQETPTHPAYIKLAVPNTSYSLHLLPVGAMPAGDRIGKRLVGTVRAKARRIDVVGTGGRYIEPVFGRPRRAQGTIVRVTSDAIVVDAGVPITCSPQDARQKPSDFEVGQFVTFAVLDGATIDIA